MVRGILNAGMSHLFNLNASPVQPRLSTHTVILGVQALSYRYLFHDGDATE